MLKVLTIFSIVCIMTSLGLCLYLIRLKCAKEKLDRSAWMFCKRCNVKWRPTAYGPATPDDYFCPECGRDGEVRVIQDIRQVIRRKEQPPKKFI